MIHPNEKNLKISFRGYSYYYRINRHNKNNQEPMLFISGAFQNMDSWRLVSDYFKTKTTTILVDLPGTGAADELPVELGFEFHVEAINHLLMKIKIDKVYVISASYGTPIAYKFAQSFPEKVTKLVLAGTMGRLSNNLKKLIKTSIQIAKKGDAKHFATYVLENGLMYNKPDASTKINRYTFVKRVLQRQLGVFDVPSLTKYIKNSRRLLSQNTLELSTPPPVKTLVFTGEYDIFTTPQDCKGVAVAFEDAVFTTIKQADHLFHLEQTKTTIELLEKFGLDISLHTIKLCNHIEYLTKRQTLALE